MSADNAGHIQVREELDGQEGGFADLLGALRHGLEPYFRIADGDLADPAAAAELEPGCVPGAAHRAPVPGAPLSSAARPARPVDGTSPCPS